MNLTLYLSVLPCCDLCSDLCSGMVVKYQELLSVSSNGSSVFFFHLHHSIFEDRPAGPDEALKVLQNRAFSSCWLLQGLLQWSTMNAQIKFLSAENPEPSKFSFEHGVCKNIALHASPTAPKFCLSSLRLPGSFNFILFLSSSNIIDMGHSISGSNL